MASFDEQMMAEMESLFGSIRQGKFVSKQTAVTPHEDQAGPGQINPVGWVVNADSDGLGASVIIDSDGIAIRNGRLLLADQFGNNVITGAGFGASWLDFVSSGFYNGHFQVGTTNNIVASTKVGTASTEADYLASLSVDLPYWVIDSETGTGTFQRFVDSAAVGGFALRWNGTETAQIFQDIPVVPGQLYSIAASWRYTAAGAGFEMRIGCQFRQTDHSVSATSTTQETGLNFSTDQATYIRQLLNSMTLLAPPDARYMRVFIKSTQTSGSPVVYVNSVEATPKLYLTTLNVGDYNNSSAGISFKAPAVTDFFFTSISGDTSSRFLLNHSGMLKWGSGAATEDIRIFRVGASILGLDNAAATFGSTLQFMEQTAPAAGAANTARLFSRDNGAGKTQLCVIFNTGAIQVIATEP